MVVIDKNYKTLLEKILKEGYTYEDPNRKGIKRLEIPSYTFRHSFSDGFPAITLKKLAWKSVVTELIWFLKGDTNIKYLVDNGCNIWNKDAYNYFLKICKEANWVKWDFKTFVETIKENKKEDLPCYNGYTLGDLGKVYGHYWRNFNGVDQIAELIHDMINKPMSSELLVVARDPSHKEEQALPCCHYGFQIVMRPFSFVEMHKNLDVKLSHEATKLIGEERQQFILRHAKYKYGFELHWKQRSVDTFLG